MTNPASVSVHMYFAYVGAFALLVVQNLVNSGATAHRIVHPPAKSSRLEELCGLMWEVGWMLYISSYIVRGPQ